MRRRWKGLRIIGKGRRKKGWRGGKRLRGGTRERKRGEKYNVCFDFLKFHSFIRRSLSSAFIDLKTHEYVDIA